jgi:geranylgeranyl diphosphate synthase type II
MSKTSKITVNSYYQARKKSVDFRLSELLDNSGYSAVTGFDDALKYTILSKGKRIRPIFALAIYELFDADIDNILNQACAIELLHAGSLMLDDLPSMDNANVRRGIKTSHTKFGESTTILASAALWVRSFELISNTNHARSSEIFKHFTNLLGPGGIVLGQYYDLEAKKGTFTREELAHHYELKTAALFRLGAKIGAILGGASKEQTDLLDEYARCLGIAFQIKDDIIDSTQTAENSGKDAHLDDINQKQNFVSTIGLKASEQALESYLVLANDALKKTDLDCKLLVSITNMLI